MTRRLVGLSVGVLVCASGCGTSGSAAGATSKEALADGKVTEAEYRAAVDAQVACLEEKGFTATARRPPDGIMWLVGVSGGDQAAMDSAATECHEAHVKGVERKFFLAHVPIGAERDALFAKFVSCLEDFGVRGVNSSWKEEAIVRAIRDQDADDMGGLVCIGQFQVLFPEGMYPE